MSNQYEIYQPVVPIANPPQQSYNPNLQDICNANLNFYVAKTNIDTQNYANRKFLDEERQKRVLVFRENLRLQAEMCKEEIFINEAGELGKRKEFLLERDRIYRFTNFKLVEKPIILMTKKKSVSVLCLQVKNEKQEVKRLLLNLHEESPGYYWRKFREAGLEVKKTRRDTQYIILQIIAVFCECADSKEIPEKHGFYYDQGGHWQYAGMEDLTWQEVMSDEA